MGSTSIRRIDLGFLSLVLSGVPNRAIIIEAAESCDDDTATGPADAD
jgi:hypothetical protein